MEQSQKLSLKIDNLKKTYKDFSELMTIDLEKYDGKILDGLKNGQIQKFEFTTEILWKTVKIYLYEIHGIDTKSPKHCIKSFYINKFIDEKTYTVLFNMLEDRNRLSHIYDKISFDSIHKKLDEYLEVTGKVLYIIENERI